MRNFPDPQLPDASAPPPARVRARRSPNDPGRRARVRLRRNRASVARGVVEMALWFALTFMLGGLAASLWRLAGARFAERSLPLRMAFPGVAALAMVFACTRGLGVLRELRALRAEQRSLRLPTPP